MMKVACLLYPHFSLYEITTLTSTLVLNFDVKIDYIASSKELMVSEDGLACQANKTLDEIIIEDYSCLILPGMIDFKSALLDDDLTGFLASLKDKKILIAAISSAPLLLAKAGLLENVQFTGGIWQNFFTYFDFLSKDKFRTLPVLQDKNIITAIGSFPQEFARKVLLSLGLTEDATDYFQEDLSYSEDELKFTLSDEEFTDFKLKFEKI